jgi:hypothetical protein
MITRPSNSIPIPLITTTKKEIPIWIMVPSPMLATVTKNQPRRRISQCKRHIQEGLLMLLTQR